MTIFIESWEDHNGICYAIVQHGEAEQRKCHTKQFEAMWPGLCCLDGAVGYHTADFDTLDQARDFLLRGISEYDKNPDIWREMAEV